MKSPDKKNIYIPKQFTLRTFNRFISQFIDRYCWGVNKSYRYRLDWINSDELPYKSYIKLREKPHHNPKYRDTSLQDHLEARNNPEWFIHANANPFSDVVMLCGDIDGEEYMDCLGAMLYIQQNYFPGCYFEPSSSNTGIHFYIFIDFSTFPSSLDKFDVFHRDRCNHIIINLSTLFSQLINSMYSSCSFDKFFGEYAIYDYSNSMTLIERKNMAKLPCPTINNFNSLTSSPFLSYSQIDKICEHISTLLLSHPTQSEGVRVRSVPSLSLNRYNYMGITTAYLPKNGDYGKLLNPLDRCRISVQNLARTLGRMPNYDEWNKYYISIEWNTGEATQRRIDRFMRVVEYVDKTFDPTLSNSEYHTAGMFNLMLKEQIGEEYLERYNKTHKKKLQWIDLDMGLGYCYVRLVGSADKKEEEGDELTVPKYGIIDYFREKKEKKEIRRSCERSKAGYIFDVLLDQGYISCVDDSYYSTQFDDNGEISLRGRSRRYVLTSKHPMYKEFIDKVGEGVVNEWLDGCRIGVESLN